MNVGLKVVLCARPTVSCGMNRFYDRSRQSIPPTRSCRAHNVIRKHVFKLYLGGRQSRCRVVVDECNFASRLDRVLIAGRIDNVWNMSEEVDDMLCCGLRSKNSIRSVYRRVETRPADRSRGRLRYSGREDTVSVFCPRGKTWKSAISSWKRWREADSIVGKVERAQERVVLINTNHKGAMRVRRNLHELNHDGYQSCVNISKFYFIRSFLLHLESIKIKEMSKGTYDHSISNNTKS